MQLQTMLSFQTNERTRTCGKAVGNGWSSGQNREKNFFRDTGSKTTLYIYLKAIMAVVYLKTTGLESWFEKKKTKWGLKYLHMAKGLKLLGGTCCQFSISI